MSEIKKLTSAGIKRIADSYGIIFVQAILFFACAGNWDMPQGWLFYGLNLICVTIANFVTATINPEILNVRGEKHTGTKRWDFMFYAACFLLAVPILPSIAGFDLGHLRGPHMPWTFSIAGCFLFVLATFGFEWAMHTNRHFEVTVRIQTDREHKVITEGPYKIVRHPGYLSSITRYLMMPVITGSFLAMIPAWIIAILFVIRTSLEDKTLRRELKGYEEYAARTRFRLIPGIW